MCVHVCARACGPGGAPTVEEDHLGTVFEHEVGDAAVGHGDSNEVFGF